MLIATESQATPLESRGLGMLLAAEREQRGNIRALHRVSCGEATANAFR